MNKSTQRERYVVFALGAAAGSALGLILGSVLAYSLGEDTVRAIGRGFRRLTGRDRKPNFELFLQ
ncbi:MAG TPA: hypothetical protein DEF47_10965 [Herpetosiphon sp.]|uniref:YtxH domain-containing protein n=1 Tax=Herpetosiphon gulosus TaxID=1973496 RepID=A0ABP9WYI7_9CHLR|nr:hypothetical protein [Herpetosiphon sp.]MCA0351227.1 hypothetical protein [Chloroflexota bacterium]HBW50417.1 hypothetical protein [Herpetosiphon sp.]